MPNSKSNNSLLSDINEFEDEDDSGIDDEDCDSDDRRGDEGRKSISIRLPSLIEEEEKREENDNKDNLIPNKNTIEKKVTPKSKKKNDGKPKLVQTIMPGDQPCDS